MTLQIKICIRCLIIRLDIICLCLTIGTSGQRRANVLLLVVHVGNYKHTFMHWVSSSLATNCCTRKINSIFLYPVASHSIVEKSSRVASLRRKAISIRSFSHSMKHKSMIKKTRCTWCPPCHNVHIQFIFLQSVSTTTTKNINIRLSIVTNNLTFTSGYHDKI